MAMRPPPRLVNRFMEFVKKIAESMMPHDVRDVLEIKDRAMYIWETFKRKVCAEGASTDDHEEEPKGPDANPFA